MLEVTERGICVRAQKGLPDNSQGLAKISTKKQLLTQDIAVWAAMTMGWATDTPSDIDLTGIEGAQYNEYPEL